jgi:hypothetical protein
VEDAHLSDGDFLADKVNVDLYMLRSSVMNEIRCYVDIAHVVAVDDCHGMKRLMKLLEQLSYPSALSHGMGNNTILLLGARVRDIHLSLGGPRDELVPKVDVEVGC